MRPGFLFALCLSGLMLTACAGRRASLSTYENDFFGLAIRAADHQSSFQILSYGMNGVKYEYDKSKMDKSITAYGRFDGRGREAVIWLGIVNNHREPLEFNSREDSVRIIAADSRETVLKGKFLDYVDGTKTIKSGQHQEIKLILPENAGLSEAESIDTIVMNIASNFPEVIVLKRLPEKARENVAL